MTLVPTLWLGPRRLIRRPVESFLLLLAVAFGTLASVTAIDATLGLLKNLDAAAAQPSLRKVEVYRTGNRPQGAVFPVDQFWAWANSSDRFPVTNHWIDVARPLLPPVETAYARFTAWVQVRLGPGAAWIPKPVSFSADPRVFSLGEVELVAGRPFTDEEWRSGARLVVLGTAVVDQLWPGLDPAQAVGRTVEVDPNPLENQIVPMVIVGVVRHRTGDPTGVEGSPSEWAVLPQVPGIDQRFGNGQVFVFVAPRVDEVPQLLGGLRTLMDRNEGLRGQALSSSYEAYRQTAGLYAGIGALVLTVGGGTLLIALWTLGSVFRSRLPSLRRSIYLLRALGADRGALAFLGLSEVLPVALGGLALGLGAAVGLRFALDPAQALRPTDPWTLAALVALAVGLQLYQIGPLVAQGRAVRSTGGVS